MSIFTENERKLLEKLDENIFVESTEKERETSLKKAVDVLKSLGFEPKISKNEMKKWISTNNSGMFGESLCISLGQLKGLPDVCTKVNKEIKPKAQVSPDNYGTIFISMKESCFTESYIGNFFVNKILLHRLSKNPELNRKSIIKFIKQLKVKYEDSLKTEEVQNLMKKRDVGDYSVPEASLKFDDGMEITFNFCYDKKSLTPGAAFKSPEGKYYVLLYPLFFESELENQIFTVMHEVGHIRLGHCEHKNQPFNPSSREDAMIKGNAVYSEKNADLYAALNGAKIYTILQDTLGSDYSRKYDYRPTNAELSQRYTYVFKNLKKLGNYNESELYEDLYYIESMFNSNKEFRINFDKWCPGTPLWITGTSGDGKSTLARELANTKNAIVVSTDLLLIRLCRSKEKWDKIVNKINSDFYMKNKNNEMIFDYIDSHPELPFELSNSKSWASRDILEPYFLDFFNWFYYNAKSNPKYSHKNIIIEGCNITYMNPEFMSAQPLIIMGNSIITTIIRRAKRDSDDSNSTNFIKELFKQIKKYNTNMKYLDEDRNKFRKDVEMFLESTNDKIVPDDSKIEKIYFKNNGEHANAYVKAKGIDKPLRGRSEVLIINGDKVYLCFKDNGEYRLPGGGWDENEPHEKSAIREAKEEAKINCTDIKYISSRISVNDNAIEKCKKENVPKEDWWYGWYTKLYVADYSKKFTGYINKEDRDDNMVKNGKWYDIIEVWDKLYPDHKDALKSQMVMTILRDHGLELVDGDRDNIKVVKESCDSDLTKFTWYHAEIARKGFNPKLAGGWDEELYSKSIEMCIHNDIEFNYHFKDLDKTEAHLYTAGEELIPIYLGIITIWRTEKGLNWEWSEQQPIPKSMVSYIKEEIHPNLLKESVMTEGVILNDKDIYYNKAKFESGETNLCFITGHSGSGKSTMAHGMEKVEVYELDDVIWNKERYTIPEFKEYGDCIYSFFNGSGKKYYYTAEEVREGKHEKFNGNYEESLIKDFVNHAISYAKSHKNINVVIEGVWLYMFIEPSTLKDYAVYIKGTSGILSTIRAAKREAKRDDKLKDKVKTFFGVSFANIKGDAGFDNDNLIGVEGKIKKYRDYFSSLQKKQEKSSVGVFNEMKNDFIFEAVQCFDDPTIFMESFKDSINDNEDCFIDALSTFLEATNNTHIIIEEIYPRVEEVLSTPNGDKLFKKTVEEFVNRNTDKLHEPCPISMIAFTDVDKSKFYAIFDFTEKELMKIVGKAVSAVSDTAQFRLVKQNPIFSVFYCVLRYYTLKNDNAGVNTTLIIHALASYPSVFSKYFKYGANPGVMKYTADHLTEKFIFKQEKHVFGALKKSIDSAYKFLKPYFKEGSDKEIIRYIQRIRNDQNSMIKKIANEYNKNYNAGKTVSTQSESYDTGSLITDYNNDTSKVETITHKIIINLLTNGIDLRILETAGHMAQLSVSELRLYLTKILIDSRSTELEEFINAVLFIYLFDEKHEVSEIKSKMFLSYGIELFRKTNSNNKNIATIKGLLDKWAEETGIHSRYRREPTRISYKKGIYWYILLTIQTNS